MSFVREYDRGDIAPVDLRVNPLARGFSAAAIDSLAVGVSKVGRAHKTEAANMLQYAAMFTEKFLEDAVAEPKNLDDGMVLRRSLALGQLNRDEQALAAAYFLKSFLGRDNSVDSNIYNFAQDAREKAMDRHDLLAVGNIGRLRFGTTKLRADYLSSIAQGLALGPSTRSAYSTVRIVHEAENRVINGRNVTVQVPKRVSGGEISPVQWLTQGHQIETVVHDHILIQNYVAESALLQDYFEVLHNKFGRWLFDGNQPLSWGRRDLGTLP